MQIAEYRNQVREQLELLETMRCTLSPDNILKDILRELLEVGERAFGEEPTVFFKFFAATAREGIGIDWKEEDLCSPLYQGREPWGALVRCVEGNMIMLVNALTRASCFLSYNFPNTSYLPPKYMNDIRTHPKWFEPFSIPDHLDISAYELQNPGNAPPLRIPNNIRRFCILYYYLKEEHFRNADAERFLTESISYLSNWINCLFTDSAPTVWKERWKEREFPRLGTAHPLYSYNYASSYNYREPTKYSTEMSPFYTKMRRFLHSRLTNADGILYDCSINVLLVYMDSISLPTYPAYDEEMRREALVEETRRQSLRPSTSTDTVKLPAPIFKPTVPITPGSMRMREMSGTIKPMPSVVHNPAKLLEKQWKHEITVKIIRDLLAELAKEAYIRRWLSAPIRADAEPVILSRSADRDRYKKRPYKK